MEAENKDKMLPELRKESRRQYLQKREKGKLDELMDDIRDDEFLFDDSQLTKREKDDRKYKKKVLELATQYSKASEIEKVQRYHMPEDRKNSELQQYVEVKILSFSKENQQFFILNLKKIVNILIFLFD